MKYTEKLKISPGCTTTSKVVFTVQGKQLSSRLVLIKTSIYIYASLVEAAVYNVSCCHGVQSLAELFDVILSSALCCHAPDCLACGVHGARPL